MAIGTVWPVVQTADGPRSAVPMYCPNCDLRETILIAFGDQRQRWHRCPKLGNIIAPMMPEGVKGKVERLEREDYVGNELVQTDDSGRPVMSVKTTTDDGENLVVFAPTATGRTD